MEQKKGGLAAIAQSGRNTQRRTEAASPAKSTPEEKPPLEFESELLKTSIAFNKGVWHYVQDLAHVLSQRVRSTGRGRVSATKLVTAAIVAFDEKSIEEQLEYINRLQ